jgi:hypothetical protein
MTVLDELVDTLLYEGYALYPYTPGAVKNATPTPFGIVYPPVYAAGSASTFDHLRLECVLRPDGAATVTATVRFLQAAGERHQGVERRLELGGDAPARPFRFDGLTGRARVRTDPLTGGLVRVRACVHNTTTVPEGLDRGAALRHSLLSTHVVVRARGGRFVSPLAPEAAGCESVNTYPVLATEADDAILGAAIILPDHPQLAPESRGSMFDSTEIEEALLLHVLALSDDERASIADQDPAVREMLARAAQATPEDVRRLHGRVRLEDPR